MSEINLADAVAWQESVKIGIGVGTEPSGPRLGPMAGNVWTVSAS